jgi:hypothetical protein
MSDLAKLSRRAALGVMARSTARASAVAMIPVTAAALAAPHGADAELLAMEAEIMRLRGLAKAIYAGTYGRDDAIDEAEKFHDPANRLCEQLMAAPALTQAGRAAKVRVLLVDIVGDDWRGPSDDLDFDIYLVRTALGEFAGMTEEELANV